MSIAVFRTAAKLTHRMYGMSNVPAIADTLKKLRMVSNIAIHKTAITMSPTKGDLSPKKTTDHRMLKTKH